MAVAESLLDSAGYCFQMALKTDPEYSPALLDLARIQRKTGEFEGAMLSLEEYLQLSVIFLILVMCLTTLIQYQNLVG